MLLLGRFIAAESGGCSIEPHVFLHVLASILERHHCNHTEEDFVENYLVEK